MTAFVIMRRQNLSLQSTFLIKLYQPEENTAVGQISQVYKIISQKYKQHTSNNKINSIDLGDYLFWKMFPS